MLTLVLAAVLVFFAVAGAELVRTACRRQLMSPVVSPALQRADAHAAAD